jgi:hypothetical protein
MEQTPKAIRCPQCGSLMRLALRCEQCDRLDPLKADEVIGWLKGELRPPK